ncbi:hypothetical protein SAMN05661096_00478 [Marivirga sericea]|uniref:DUF4149 domain-containing protein n=1 Tax=Marivirga sericea TaxID=1028 RepID=A0A1X7IC39_9BACT|nr:hypothetical protein SAMN05661096_00478 [Marivirga sericea]
MLHYIKELSDFGLFVLIWLVQLIIYPSFTFMKKSSLIIWHPIYTKRISVVVMPLMLLQIALTFYLTYSSFNYFLLFQSIIIIFIWISTFFQAVPLHNQIESGVKMKKAAEKLVQANWKRTIMWSLIVILNFLDRFTTLNN